ncbi:MAG: hypothetical protein WCV82_02550 [Candidatus Paceibacterota bacterium]
MNTSSTTSVRAVEEKESWLRIWGENILFALVICVGTLRKFVRFLSVNVHAGYNNLCAGYQELTPEERLTICVCVPFCLFIVTLTVLSLRW